MGKEGIGIVSFGAYVPRYRLKRELIAAAWGRAAAGGEKAVANYDEDSVTLAMDAASNCLAGADPNRVDGLFFASTSPPYAEREHAGLIAAVTDLRESVVTADFGHSLRAGTQALRAALDAVRTGAYDRLLVTAAEQRAPEPGSELEMHLGDGAVALLLGSGDVLAELEGVHSLSNEFTDLWRRSGDRYVRSADPPFALRYGYRRTLKNCVQGLLERQRIGPRDVQKVALYAPDPRSLRQVLLEIGFHPQEQAVDSLYEKVGILGSAHPLLLLAAALEAAKPGDLLLMASYGNGSDAFLFRATDRIVDLQTQNPLRDVLKRNRGLHHYNHYLRFRNSIRLEASVPFTQSEEPFSSVALLWKERKQDMRFYGSRCRACGRIHFPMRRICLTCRARDQMDDHKLARRGVVYTFTRDYVFMTPDPPGVMVVVDLDGGGRFYGQMTDCSADEVTIGLPVELTCRKWHEAMGVSHYFWKCRPVAAEKRPS